MAGERDATTWDRRSLGHGGRLVCVTIAGLLAGCSGGDPGVNPNAKDGGVDAPVVMTDGGRKDVTTPEAGGKDVNAPEVMTTHDTGGKPDTSTAKDTGVDTSPPHDAGSDTFVVHDAGHDAGSDAGHDAAPPPTFTIGGVLVGLPAGDTLTLLDNGGDSLPLTADGPFMFSMPEMGYKVTIGSQPADATCMVVSGAEGTATAPVTSVDVACMQTAFTLGGTLTGLPATQTVTLSNPGMTGPVSLPLSMDGPFMFPGTFPPEVYDVTVTSQPKSAFCTVAGGSAPFTGDVSNVAVSCAPSFTIGGMLSGLPNGATIVLADNGGDDLPVTANGPFTFPSSQIGYAVTVAMQPGGAHCSVTNATGTATANVSNVAVTCLGSGTFDTTFGGGNGFVLYEANGNYHNNWFRLAMNPDDSFVLAGYNQTTPSSEDWYVSKLLATGAFDVTFGGVGAPAGSIDIPLGSAIGQRAETVARASNGEYYVGGQFEEGGGNGFDMSVVKLTAAGVIDTNYATNGVATYNLAGTQEAFGMNLYADGTVLLAGISGGQGSVGTTMIFVRFTPAGALDATFGTGGVVTFGLATNDTEADDVVVDANGNITAVGIVNTTAEMIQLTANGALNNAFGTGGVVTVDLTGAGQNSSFNRVRLDSAGNIVAGGNAAGASTSFAVARFSAAGVIDPTFGTGGISKVNDGSGDNLTALTIAPGGNILFGGNSGLLGAVGRMIPNGSVDAGFATNGLFKSSFGGNFACNVYDIGVDSQGRIVLGGSFAPTKPELGAARLNP
jgi:uncharacterized delta-60 repeat protein